jgi:DNA-3-methyladenine glycosylase II
MDRSDVFPVDDLGIQNNMKAIYGLTTEKKELKLELVSISNSWSPFRTLACKYVWGFK